MAQPLPRCPDPSSSSPSSSLPSPCGFPRLQAVPATLGLSTAKCSAKPPGDAANARLLHQHRESLGVELPSCTWDTTPFRGPWPDAEEGGDSVGQGTSHTSKDPGAEPSSPLQLTRRCLAKRDNLFLSFSFPPPSLFGPFPPFLPYIDHLYISKCKIKRHTRRQTAQPREIPAPFSPSNSLPFATAPISLPILICL